MKCRELVISRPIRSSRQGVGIRSDTNSLNLRLVRRLRQSFPLAHQMAVSQDAADPAPAATSDRTRNVGEVSEQLYGTDYCPRQFVWDENLRTGAQSLESGLFLPVMDMLRMEAGGVEAVKKEMTDATGSGASFRDLKVGVSDYLPSNCFPCVPARQSTKVTAISSGFSSKLVHQSR